MSNLFYNALRVNTNNFFTNIIICSIRFSIVRARFSEYYSTAVWSCWKDGKRITFLCISCGNGNGICRTTGRSSNVGVCGFSVFFKYCLRSINCFINAGGNYIFYNECSKIKNTTYSRVFNI